MATNMTVAFAISTGNGDLIGVAANEEIAIRIMIKYITERSENSDWFDDEDYTLDEAIKDIKSKLHADGFISAEPIVFWTE